jgi:predicted CopG family antitoxin
MFLTLVLQVVLAVVVAKLTLAGSKSQKWWERKADLYSNLLERLYDIRKSNSKWLDDYYTNDALSEAEKERHDAEEKLLLERNKKAEDEVEKLTHIGAFLISEEVHQDLNTFKKAEREALANYEKEKGGGNPLELQASIEKAVAKCIESIREHAKDDLGLNRRFGRFIQRMRAHLSE